MLIKDGEIIAAAQEERFTRKKHDLAFPTNAIQYCIKEANIESSELSNIVFYEKPFVKFERLLETYLAFAPKGFKSFIRAMPIWIKDKLFQKATIVNELKAILGDNIDWKIGYYFQNITCLMLQVHFTHLLLKAQLS